MINPNPVLKRLGYENNDKVVIIHADDIGMCHSSIAASKELFEIGIITSGAVMVPCPWFLAALELKNDNPKVDLGVHLTLTSEWKTYRWGPISTRDVASGLIDSQGYFHSETSIAQEAGDPKYAAVELYAQVERMLKTGFSPTHIDTHMGTVAHPKFMSTYIELGLKYGIPLMMFRMDEQGWINLGLDQESAKGIVSIIANLEEMGFPLLDNLRSMTLDDPDFRFDKAKEIFKNLPSGLTHFIIHPSIESLEIRSITPDWQSRVGDYNVFRDESILRFLEQEGIHRIGYHELQKLIPTSG